MAKVLKKSPPPPPAAPRAKRSVKPAPRPSKPAIPETVEAPVEFVDAVFKPQVGKASRVPVDQGGVVVVGSLNMDLVVRTEAMPSPGQTVMGHDLMQNPGGKGANQATAAGRLSKKGKHPACRMIGRVGDDAFGVKMIAALQNAGVDTASIISTKNTPSGTAMIIVDRHGENSIVVAGGANAKLGAPDLLAQRKAIEAAKVLAVQLECPFDAVACAIALAKQAGVLTILDPAPAPLDGLPESLFHVDILSPNQSEAQMITGIPVRNVDDARRAGERMLARGTGMVVLKMGSSGAVIVKREESGTITHKHILGFKVPVVDTTAAGDAFTGALGVALAEGMPIEQAVRFANAAGALACTKPGAAGAIPTRAQVEALIAGV